VKTSLRLGGVVLSKVLVTVGVHDRPGRAAFSQGSASSLAVSVVGGATVEGEVGRLVDERSGP